MLVDGDEDFIEHGLQGIVHFGVCESNDAKPALFEDSVTTLVRLLLILVNAAVDFNDECRDDAEEIDNETVNDLLTAKVMA